MIVEDVSYLLKKKRKGYQEEKSLDTQGVVETGLW